MALNFPDSPANGDTTTLNGVVYTYNATAAVWDTISAAAAVDFTAIASNILPDADSSRDLGSASKKWKDLFLSGDTINLGDIKLKDAGGSLKVETSAGADVSPGGTKIYANLAAFPASGNAAGDIGFATDTKASYMWDGVAWQRISIGSQIGPRYTTTPSGSHNLTQDGTASTITAVAVDESGFPVTYDWDAISGSTLYNDDSLPPQLASITKSNGVFTLTPSTAEANAGDFSFRVKASDGVLVTPAISSVSLAFSLVITIAARQTRGSNYVEPTSTGVTQFNYASAASGSNYNYFPEGATASAASWPTGKRYIEAKWTSTDGSFGSFMLGVGERTASHNNASTGGYTTGSSTTSAYAYSDTGGNYIAAGNNQTSGLGAYVLNDTFTIAYDTDAEKVWIGKNGTWGSGCGDPGASGAGFPLSYANGGYAFVVASVSNNGGNDFTITWGGSNYTIPTGFSHF